MANSQNQTNNKSTCFSVIPLTTLVDKVFPFHLLFAELKAFYVQHYGNEVSHWTSRDTNELYWTGWRHLYFEIQPKCGKEYNVLKQQQNYLLHLYLNGYLDNEGLRPSLARDDAGWKGRHWRSTKLEKNFNQTSHLIFANFLDIVGTMGYFSKKTLQTRSDVSASRQFSLAGVAPLWVVHQLPLSVLGSVFTLSHFPGISAQIMAMPPARWRCSTIPSPRRHNYLDFTT